jgi:flagellar basal-body rod protein FlgF
VLVAPGLVDSQQGDLENTGNPLDLGIQGGGYFTVSDGKTKSLTRDGAFMLNNAGDLVLSSSQKQHVLDEQGNPIHIAGGGASIQVLSNGQMLQNEQPVAKLQLVDVADPSKFTKRGANLLVYPADGDLRPANGEMHGGFQERANVDPTHELVDLMDTQRQLEANANMIKTQDSMLDKLVNDVAKIS